MRIQKVCSAVLLGLVAVTASQEVPDVDAAITLLRKVHPEVSWDRKLSAVADVTCDGVSDVLVVGRGTKAAWLGVVPGGAKGAAKPILLRFGLGGRTQDDFCETPVRIKTSPIQCNSDETGPLQGCRVVKGCRDISIEDDACDPFNVYWDADHKQLTWRRN